MTWSVKEYLEDMQAAGIPSQEAIALAREEAAKRRATARASGVKAHNDYVLGVKKPGTVLNWRHGRGKANSNRNHL